MASSEFRHAITNLSSIGETIRLSCTKDNIEFIVEGFIGTAKLTYKNKHAQDNSIEFRDHPHKIRLRCDEPVKGNFTCKHLLVISKSGSLHDSVTISMSNDCPVCVQYRYGDAGYLRYYLAPLIDDESDDDT